MEVPPIAIITVTCNASTHIRDLAESLAAQTDKNFNWIVKDCCSTDSTVSIVQQFKHLFAVHTIVSPDTGIYDGLNQAIIACESTFYLAAGADDRLSPNAVADLNNFLKIDGYASDLYLNSIKVGNKTVFPGSGNGFFFGMHGFAANHSLGCMIRRNIHYSIGFYDTKFRLAADSKFLYQLVRSGCELKRTGVFAGEFSIGGVSTAKLLFTSHSEFAFVQLLNFPRFRLVQIFLFIIRLCKNCYRY